MPGVEVVLGRANGESVAHGRFGVHAGDEREVGAAAGAHDDLLAAGQANVVACFGLHGGQQGVFGLGQVEFDGVGELDLVGGVAPAALLEFGDKAAAGGGRPWGIVIPGAHDVGVNLDEDGFFAPRQRLKLGQHVAAQSAVAVVEGGAFGDVENRVGQARHAALEDLGRGQRFPAAFGDGERQARGGPAPARLEVAPGPALQEVGVGQRGEGLLPGGGRCLAFESGGPVDGVGLDSGHKRVELELEIESGRWGWGVCHGTRVQVLSLLRKAIILYTYQQSRHCRLDG